MSRGFSIFNVFLSPSDTLHCAYGVKWKQTDEEIEFVFLSLRRKQVTEAEVTLYLSVPTPSPMASSSFFFRPLSLFFF